ncbi:MAG: bifunctional histidinol-phosphatase/imidazoleglycerol-phosphate dehydratase HisB [Alistipes sp.]|jgi:imidazoleglycerol-phosphate dehydratase/histidinol-phosphatase|nr:bifunctional histidinol-phosphatase/imidazoleglycerol-phosphate dehydratase HisB [Alistipes sp.]
MKRALFIDRDGTLVVERPTDDLHVDLEHLQFLPGVISGMKTVSGLGYELVLASNQDGLGTAIYPEQIFRDSHRVILDVLASEGVRFDDELIDVTMPEEGAATRKPGIGMFGEYLKGDYDLGASYVIGDRITDIILARNLGARGILIQPLERGREMVAAEGLQEVCALISDSWSEIAEFLRAGVRTAEVKRVTKETDITVGVDLDGRGASRIDTGLKFLDHMLDQIVHHAGVSLNIEAKGDLHVDEHHTMEDVAIVLGEALIKALGDRRGIGRYGFALPMDESRAMVLIDLGGRIDFEWSVTFERERVGDVPTEMFRHFFKSLGAAMHCGLHIEARGANDHHIAEGIFKAFARALKAAVRREPFSDSLPSSKGVI